MATREIRSALSLCVALSSACSERQPVAARRAPLFIEARDAAAPVHVVPVPRIQAALQGLPSEADFDDVQDPAAALEAARHDCCEQMPATEIEKFIDHAASKAHVQP